MFCFVLGCLVGEYALGRVAIFGQVRVSASSVEPDPVAVSLGGLI